MLDETDTYEQQIDSELAELEGYLQGLENICIGNPEITIPGDDLFSLINMATEKVQRARAIRPAQVRRGERGDHPSTESPAPVQPLEHRLAEITQK